MAQTQVSPNQQGQGPSPPQTPRQAGIHLSVHLELRIRLCPEQLLTLGMPSQEQGPMTTTSISQMKKLRPCKAPESFMRSHGQAS